MTLKIALTDDQIGRYTKRMLAILDRTGKSLDFKRVMEGLQLIHDGKLVTRLIEPLTTIRLPKLDTFVVDERLHKGDVDGVLIHSISNDFHHRFGGKVEPVMPRATFTRYGIMRDVSGAVILSEFAKPPEITIGQFWELLKKNGRSEQSVIAFVRDVDGRLCTARSNWSSERGFSLYVDPDNLHREFMLMETAGDRLFARKTPKP